MKYVIEYEIWNMKYVIEYEIWNMKYEIWNMLLNMKYEILMSHKNLNVWIYWFGKWPDNRFNILLFCFIFSGKHNSVIIIIFETINYFYDFIII